MYIFLDNWCSFHILFIYIALSNTQMEYLLILSGINFYRLLFYSEKKCSFYILVSYSGNKIIFYTDFNWSALWFFVLCTCVQNLEALLVLSLMKLSKDECWWKNRHFAESISNHLNNGEPNMSFTTIGYLRTSHSLHG